MKKTAIAVADKLNKAVCVGRISILSFSAYV